MREPALTLVELLASLVIVTMLVIAALGVTTSLARSELTLRRQEGEADGPDRALRALVEADLVHAHHWRSVEGGFAVQTNVRLDSKTLRLAHVPSVVTYRIRKVDQRSYLVRIQETGRKAQHVELAAVGAAQITFTPEKDIRPNRYGWTALTDGCTIRIALEGEGTAAREVSVRIPRGGGN